MATERRSPADLSKPLARLVQSTLTVSDIVGRPIWCLRPEMAVRDAVDAMQASGFDISGVTGTPVSNFVRLSDLEAAKPRRRVKEIMVPILGSQCVERTLPIGRLLDLLISHEMVFILDGADVRWLVNRSDLSAPVVSIAVLAHLAAIEEGIKEVASSFSEAEILEAMNNGLENAQNIFESLRDEGVEVGLLDCFFFGDWMDFVRNTPAVREALGYTSRTKFRETAYPLKRLRNHTAHGRGILAAETSPDRALKTVRKALDFAARVWKLVDEQQPIWDRFADTQIVPLKPGRATLAGLGARKSWPWPGHAHILTAWNPGGIWSPHERNIEANHHLEETLRRHGADVLPVVGKSLDGKWREDGFLVFGLKRQQAADLGSAFGQLAVFEIDSHTLSVVRSDDGEIVRIRPRVRSERSS